VAVASVELLWRNPKVHAADRVKTWLSCPDHQQYLVDYLQVRGFFLGLKEIQ
jgi:hypothetical protein